MKKKIITLLMAMVMVITTLTGCNSTTKESSDKTATGSKKYTVAMICDSSITDGGWGTACYNAMLVAAKEYGFETYYTDALDFADFESAIRSYCDINVDLIFAPGGEFSDAVKAAAADYPDVKFALLNGSLETNNIVSILPDAKQIGYMAGSLAGLTTKTNIIGFIGGIELDTTLDKLKNYEIAAKAVNPNIHVVSAYAGSFSDAAKGKEIANAMVTVNNADVLFGDASAVDSGAREALSNYTDRYDIGQPSDLLADQKSNVIINSVVTDNSIMVGLCMSDIINNSFGNKTIYGNLSNGSLNVGIFSKSVPENIKTQYLEIIEKIKNNTFIQ
ncbi:BMP family protein [[Clostridium] fimetarium]|uniref:Basic membrane protein A n=1 Tax=[Clostridium] fimetarium TaxID=99656 RepID=A0A1I0Q7J9_9FIRM|nr:BMP family protein [[Clostridium] fimetarium]SEW22547.1 basic membrane protein A [[Clostridium] fimetarium]